MSRSKQSNFFSSETQRSRSGLELALEGGWYFAVVLLLWILFSTQIVAPLNEVLSGANVPAAPTVLTEVPSAL
jgi:hypothetical protein